MSDIRTARALVEVEEATSQANGTGQAHDGRETALADVRRRESLHGQEGRRGETGRYRAVNVVRRASIADDSLEVPIPRKPQSQQLYSSTNRALYGCSYGSLSMSCVVGKSLASTVQSHELDWQPHCVAGTHRIVALDGLRELVSGLRCVGHGYGRQFAVYAA